MPGFGQRSPLQPDQNSLWTKTQHLQTKMTNLQTKTPWPVAELDLFSTASSPKLAVESWITGALYNATWILLEWRVTHKKHVMREPSRCCSCTSGSAAGSIASLVQHVVGAARIGTTVASHSIKRILSVTPTPKHTHTTTNVAATMLASLISGCSV